MPIVRFNKWSEPRPDPLLRGQRLVTKEVGAQNITSGISRFQPGARIPLHYHDIEEQVTIIEGRAVAIIDGQRVELDTYDTTYVPAGVKHHFMNESDAPMAIIYFYPTPNAVRHDLEGPNAKPPTP